MADTQNGLTTNVTSILCDGYATFIPDQEPVTKSDFSILIQADGSVTLNNGQVIFTSTGGVNPDTMSVLIDRINRNSIVAKLPQEVTKQVVEITFVDPDYSYANVQGLSTITVQGVHLRDEESQYHRFYSHAFPEASKITAANRVLDMIKRFESDPTAKFVATVKGANANAKVLVLTAKQPGVNYKVTTGQPHMTPVKTPAKSSLGTGALLKRGGTKAPESATILGAVYKVLQFSTSVRMPATQLGFNHGGKVDTNAYCYVDKAVHVYFAPGTDTQIAALKTILQGKFVPAEEYYARLDDLAFV